MVAASEVDGVRVLGKGVPYLDGAEDRLFQIVSEAPDRSSRSDDLAASITDWPTRYHLSRLRSNLLLPLQLRPGIRVLDVGCGTGALTRAIAESGADVTGVEGSFARARVAAARTSEFANCDIVSGSLEEYLAEGHEGEFDVIVVCGVLEYSVSFLGGEDGPQQMLSQVRALVKPDGVVALAIENQIGLKYLVGYPEDHRSLPWVGIDGYRSGRNPAQTWSRTALSKMLAEGGFPQQRWMFPFPDYKLPTVIVSEEAFRHPQGQVLVRQFVRNPVLDYSGSTQLTVDAVSGFQTMLDAGLGPDTANSFLVFVGGEDSDPGSWLADGMLWISTGERSAEFMDARVLRLAGDQWSLVPLRDRPEVHLPPLVSSRTDLAPVIGSNLEDELVAIASRADSPLALKPLLDEWWQAARPWLVAGEYHFDIMPRNFIRSPEGELVYVDREWTWTDPAPESWALLRSMWFLVISRLWPAGALAGLSWSLTLREAVLALARVAVPATSSADLEDAIAVEVALQSRVSGNAAEDEEAGLRHLLDKRLSALTPRPSMAQIVERPAIMEAEARRREESAAAYELSVRDDLIGTKAQLQSAQARNQDLEAKIAWLRKYTPILAVRRVGQRVKRKLKQ